MKLRWLSEPKSSFGGQVFSGTDCTMKNIFKILGFHSLILLKHSVVLVDIREIVVYSKFYLFLL